MAGIFASFRGDCIQSKRYNPHSRFVDISQRVRVRFPAAKKKSYNYIFRKRVN